MGSRRGAGETSSSSSLPPRNSPGKRPKRPATLWLLAFIFRIRGLRSGLRSSLLPDILNKADTLLAQNALDTTNGVTLAVKQVTDAAQQINIIGPVIAPASAALHRLDLREINSPKIEARVGAR